jgi:hypothetical protein
VVPVHVAGKNKKRKRPAFRARTAREACVRDPVLHSGEPQNHAADGSNQMDGSVDR